MLLRVLIAVDSPPVRRALEGAFQEIGANVAIVRSGPELWTRLHGEAADLVLLGESYLTDSPRQIIESIRQLPEHPDVVVIRAREQAEERAALIAAGALAVLWEKLPAEGLADAIRALAKRRRGEAIVRLRADRPQEQYSLNDFISVSLAMRQFMAMVRRVAATESTVLIQGETGVGKERLARAIHNEGRRAAAPFIAVNSGAFPEGILESELFGHEKGAFTGAARARRGYFELAHRGTLFLDEVADIPTHLQAKLLRVLEERTVRRLGGERETSVDVRIMAATNRDLESETKSRQFRLDLYYRLAVVTLAIPPLRDRSEDIPLLAQSYIDHFRALLHSPILGTTDAAMCALRAYTWPGNVRELINVIERAMLLCETDRIDLPDLPLAVVEAEGGASAPMVSANDALLTQPLPEAKERLIRDFERLYLVTILRRTYGKVGDAARHAGVNVRSIHEMMKRHGLKKEAFKPPR